MLSSSTPASLNTALPSGSYANGLAEVGNRGACPIREGLSSRQKTTSISNFGA